MYKLKFLFDLFNSKLIVTTHGPLYKTKKNITIDLWHGIPMKGMNLMDSGELYPKPLAYIDYFNVCSNFEKTILNSCFGMKQKKYTVLGSARNDYLFNDKNSVVKTLLNINKNAKLICFLPTYRDQFNGNYKSFVSKLTFDKFNLSQFNLFLKKNNFFVILKYHPNDKNLLENQLRNKKLSNFRLLSEGFLKTKDLELYELLGCSDLLITDYSSVYLDYLLTEKPIIFIPTKIEEYKKNRGFLLEPYDFWTPGPKCLNQMTLEKEILLCLKSKNYYLAQRLELKDVFHKYKDNKSTKRIVDFIISKINLD